MKTLRSFFPMVLLLIIAAVSIRYSVHTAARVRDLEQRLQRAETALQVRSQPLADTTTAARIRSLEARVRQAESVVPQAQFASGNDASGLERRIQGVEQTIKPHLETLPPYNPYK